MVSQTKTPAASAPPDLPPSVAPSPGTTRPSSATTRPAVRAFVDRVAETTQVAVATRRPWSELTDRQAFDKPDSFANALSRVRKNAAYFRMNYLICMLILVGLSLLWHPTSLIVLALLVVAWIYFYFSRSEPVVLFNRTFTENEVMIILGILTVVALFLTKAGSTLTTVLVIGIALILLHAAFRRPDDLFLDEQENAASGLYNFPTSTGFSRV